MNSTGILRYKKANFIRDLIIMHSVPDSWVAGNHEAAGRKYTVLAAAGSDSVHVHVPTAGTLLTGRAVLGFPPPPPRPLHAPLLVTSRCPLTMTVNCTHTHRFVFVCMCLSQYVCIKIVVNNSCQLFTYSCQQFSVVHLNEFRNILRIRNKVY